MSDNSLSTRCEKFYLGTIYYAVSSAVILQRHWYWPSSDKVIGMCQQRRKPVSFPDYFLFIYLMGRGRNRFFNLCVGVGHFLHSRIEFSSWNSPEARSKMKMLFPRVRTSCSESVTIFKIDHRSIWTINNRSCVHGFPCRHCCLLKS